jgi:hypothetical protein
MCDCDSHDSYVILVIFPCCPQQFHILRARFLASGFTECEALDRYTGSEDALWILGHVTAGGSGLFTDLRPHQVMMVMGILMMMVMIR